MSRGQLSNGKKLTELDVTRQAKKDVIALYISVDHTVPMQVLQTPRRLTTDGSNLALRHKIRSNDVCERTTFHVFHDNPEVIAVQERIDIVDDVWMPGGTHNKNLVYNEIFLWLLIQIHLLDGDAHVGSHLIGCENAARRTG